MAFLWVETSISTGALACAYSPLLQLSLRQRLILGPGGVLDMQSGEFTFPASSDHFPYSFQNSGEINVFQDAVLGMRESTRNFSSATINVIDGGFINVHADGAVLNTSTQNTGNGTINMSNFSGSDSTITGGNEALTSINNQFLDSVTSVTTRSVYRSVLPQLLTPTLQHKK